MEEIRKILREAMPKIIASLAVALVTGWVAFFWQKGKPQIAIAVGLAFGILLFLVMLWLGRGKPPEELPTEPTPPTVMVQVPPAAPGERPIPQPPRRRGPVGFVARHDEEGRDLVEVVTKALEGDSAVNLWGSGGVGKTTLAIEISHRLLPSLPGGVIWADADGRAEFNLAALLDEILARLGREDACTLAPEAKASLACSLLGERRCLLAVDHFEAAKEQEAILTFLGDVPCAVLVTGRKFLEPLRNIKIMEMSPDEAREFLRSLVEISPHRAKLERVDLDEVARVAERNPWVMRSIVAQLEKAMRLQDVFDDLARGKGEAAERVFGRSFELLGDDGQAALLALSLFVPDASREALAAVSGFGGELGRANEAIADMAGLALLELADERVGLAGLTRRLARAWLARDKWAGELVGRFVSYFLAYAESHSQLTPEDFDALEEERENLLAAMDYAYAAEDWQSVMQIRSALEEFLDVRGYWDEAIRRGEQAVEAARAAGDEWAVAQFSGNVGGIYLNRGDYDEARRRYQDALEAFRRLKSDKNVAVALHNLGAIAHDQGDYNEARRLYGQSLEIKRKLGDQLGIATTLAQMALLEEKLDNLEEALKLISQAEEIFKRLGVPEAERARRDRERISQRME